MHRYAPFRLLTLSISFVLVLAACSDNPTTSQSTFSLSVTLEGQGSVTLTTSDAGLPVRRYQDSFERSLTDGTVVTLSATPAAGFRFGAWGDDCEAEEPTCTFTLDADRQVALTFEATTEPPPPPPPSEAFDLVVATAGDGVGTVTSTPGGIDCGETCQASFEGGTAVTLTAAAAAGSSFTGWQGACAAETSNVCTLTPSADQTVTATFAPQAPTTYDLTVTVTGEGQVTAADGTLACPDLCTAAYAENTQVTLTATPASGYAFSGWEGACQGTEPSCAVEVSGNLQVTAVFEVVTGTGQTFTVSKGLASGSDDAEEYLKAVYIDAGRYKEFFEKNAVDIKSGDIDFVYDKIGRTNQVVGLRFTDLAIPPGAVITDARIQFQIDHGTNRPADLTVRTQADAKAPTFVHQALYGISGRPTGVASVRWQIAMWPDLEGKKDDPNALTPNLAAIVQEVVSRPEWENGDNALVFIFTGEGQNQATSFEDTDNPSGQSTRLTVTYQVP